MRFGIWDLPQKVTTKAKFGPLGQNWDFFGTIFGPFRDLSRYFHENAKNVRKGQNNALSQHFPFQNISNGQ